MKKIKIALILMLSIGLVQAQTIERLDLQRIANQSELKGALIVTGNSQKEATCGVLLNFGDDTAPELIEASINQPTEFKHVYGKTGTFQLKAEGRGIVRLFSAVQPCAERISRLVNIFDQTQFAADSLDIVVMVKTKSSRNSRPPSFASNLDGTPKLVNMDSVLCLNTSLLRPKPSDQGDEEYIVQKMQQSKQLELLAADELYKQADLLDAKKTVETHFERVLQTLQHTGNSNDACRREYEAPSLNNLGMLSNSQAFAIPKYLLPNLQKMQFFKEINSYTPLYTLTLQEAKQISQTSQESAAQAALQKKKTTEEFNSLAQSNSKDRVGSLILGADSRRRDTKNVCTLSYKDLDAAAISGYRGLNTDMLLPQMKERYAKQGISFSKGFNKVFENINDAFVEISLKPETCGLFVDYPNNLSELEAGFKRVKNFPTSLGSLMDSNAARELFATQRGYADYKAYIFAKSISGGAEDVKKLKTFGIIDKAGFDELALEMQQSQYSKTVGLDVIYMYLNDREAAKLKKTTVVAERDFRVAEDNKRREKEQIERQRRREAYAKEFPYEAVISCEFQGRHSNLVPCFAGGRNDASTELEIRNGTNYGMYKSYDLYRLGSEQSGEGLIVPLGNTFEVKAQNASDTLTLTVKIRETATGKNIYTKSAAQYGVVRVNR